MTLKISTRYSLFLISGLLFVSFVAWACGGWYYEYSDQTMFTPDVIRKPVYQPFFRDEYMGWDGGCESHKDSFQRTNVLEWFEFFERKIPQQTISDWLYTYSISQVDTMIFTLQGKMNPKSDLYTLSELHRIKPTTKATGFLYFLGFAKRNEPIATYMNEYEWEYGEYVEHPRDTVEIDEQLNGGLKLLTKVTDPFLKERYLFQIERLYFFRKEYAKAVSFFEENESLFRSNNSMKWRTMSYAAGALYKMKQYGKANYLYSKVYVNCDVMKQTAQFCFHPQEDSDWNQSLAFAKTNEEAIALWHLLGTYADELRAMKEICALDPKSEMLDLLLVRAVNIREEGLSFYGGYGYSEDYDKRVYRGNNSLQKFVASVAEQQATANPQLWYMASSYLSYWENDFATGDAHLQKAKDLLKSDNLAAGQISIISIVGKILRAKKIDADFENNILSEVKAIFQPLDEQLRTGRAKIWVRKTLAGLYDSQGEFEKAEVVNPHRDAWFYTIPKIENIIAYFDKPSKSPLQAFLLPYSEYSRQDYADLLGVSYAQNDELEKSVPFFKTTMGEYDMLLGDPFLIHIKDCHDCDHDAAQKVKYTKRTFIAKLIELKAKAMSNPKDAAESYFLVANGFYNMTYYGNARLFYWSPITDYYDADENDTMKAAKKFDCSLALKYYLLARENSTNKEFRAKCTFMAAKCEQNIDFGGSYLDGETIVGGVYYKELKQAYSLTKYYKEILKECGYFSAYAKKN